MSVVIIDSDGTIVEELRSNQRKIMEALGSLGLRLEKLEETMARVDDELQALRATIANKLAEAEEAARAAEDALRTALENDAIDDAAQAQALTDTLDNSAADKIAALREELEAGGSATPEPEPTPDEPGAVDEPAEPAEPVGEPVDENPPGTGV